MKVSGEEIRKALKKSAPKTRTIGYAVKMAEQMQVVLRREHSFVHKFSREKAEAAYLLADLLTELLIPMQEELAERIAFDFTLLDKET